MKSSFHHPVAHVKNQLGTLTERMAFQAVVLQKIKSALPEELANHVECCLLKPGKLLIFTDSSAWAAKLRFHQQTILAGLGEWLTPETATLRVKLLHHFERTAKTRTVMIPPKTVIENIRAIAEASGDPQLKEALTRLSNRLDRVRAEE